MQGGAGIPVPGHSQEWRPLIPFPELWEWIFSFPSRSRILGMDFFHSLPIPGIWEWIFLFPSRSRISGMGFFNSLPVPEPSKVIPAHPCNSVVFFFQFNSAGNPPLDLTSL